MAETLFSNDVARLTLKDRQATLEISRPQALNALNADVLESVCACMRRLGELTEGGTTFEQAAVLLLRGAGDKAFVAGADIKLMREAAPAQLQAFIALGQRAMREVERSPLPVIAVIQGFALGGGLELALAADLIVASEQARLGQPEVNLGLIPGFGGTQRLTARVGVGTAKRLIFSGETITGGDAHVLGLVDYLVPPERLEHKVEELTTLLKSKSPLAIAAAKRSIHALHGEQLSAGLAREVEEFIELFASADSGEGLSAFLEKRSPSFGGRKLGGKKQ